VILVDEAGMASTRDLDALTRLARERGCVIRMVGDPAQLAAVEAGGAFRLLAHRTDAVELDTLHRFHDPAEAKATLAVRAGERGAADFYEDNQRLHGGSREGVLEQIYAAWRGDIEAGRSSLMLASDSETVRQLSTRARLDRVAAGEVEREGVGLHDGSTAARGDVVVTRRNDRRLATAGGRDFVKNGDLWLVEEVETDGALQLRHKHRGGAMVRVPADYADRHVELGYALTVHRAQGVTVDVTRSLVDEATSREAAYVAGSRGRAENHFYAVTHAGVDVDLHHPSERDATAREVFETVVGNDTADRSAHETIADAQEHAESLARLIPEYEHARGAAASHEGIVDQAITETLGRDVLAQLREDPAWHALADRVAALPDEGRDPAAVLAAAAEGDLENAQSRAAVLTWRINQAAPRGGIEDWIGRPTTSAASREPSGSGERGDLGAWLEDRRTQIRGRVDHLAATAIEEQPQWLPRIVGERPAPESARAGGYEAAVRAAVSYRDRYEIRETTTPLGHEPTDGRQLRDWRRVHELARTAQEAGARPGRERVDLADRVRQLREKNQRLTEQRRDGQQGQDVEHDRLARERERQELDRQAEQRGDDLEL
jgi:hypothetical protein